MSYFCLNDIISEVSDVKNAFVSNWNNYWNVKIDSAFLGCLFSLKFIAFLVLSSREFLFKSTCRLFQIAKKGMFDHYVLWPFDKKLIFSLVTCIRTRDYMVSFYMRSRLILFFIKPISCNDPKIKLESQNFLPWYRLSKLKHNFCWLFPFWRKICSAFIEWINILPERKINLCFLLYQSCHLEKLVFTSYS